MSMVMHDPGSVDVRMSPAALAAQSVEMRELLRSVLTEGVDFGKIPGTPKPALFKAGAEWLMKWARMGHRLDQVNVERDLEGRPYGVTYRCSIHLLSDPDVTIATCDGYAGYDEPDREAHKTKWGKEIARSPWNTILKMAQKRALVGATLQATGTSGLFTQDVEDATAEPPASEAQRAALQQAIMDLPADQKAVLKVAWQGAGLPPISSKNLDQAHVVRIQKMLDSLEIKAAHDAPQPDVVDDYADAVPDPAEVIDVDSAA